MQTASIAQNIFLTILSFKLIAEYYLDLRNKNYIIKNSSTVPKDFTETISLEDHKKAANYSITKINTSNFFRIIRFGILLLWTVAGGLNYINNFVATYNLSAVWSGLIVFGLFMGISHLLSIPEEIYTTFVIEEKFGFNKTTPKTFLADQLKGLTLGAVIGLPLIFALLKLMGWMGPSWWFYAFVLITGLQVVLLWAYPTLIAPLFNKFSPLEDGEVKTVIESLMKRVGFKSSGIFVMDASKRSAHGNAYFTGFGKVKRIVFFDTLLKTLTKGEIEGVLAHELGHFKKKHVFKMIIRSFLLNFAGLFLLGKLYTNKIFFQMHGIESINGANAIILFVLIISVYTFWITPIFNGLSRKHEFEADNFAVANSNGKDLIRALSKLYKENASTLTPDPLYSKFYHSHPPASIRIANIYQTLNHQE